MTRRSPPPRPFPFADLERLVRPPVGANGQPRRPLSVVADRVGVRYDSARRLLYRNAGMLTEPQADRWATACGFHPAEVWPEWTDILVAAHEAAEEARRERRRAYLRVYMRRWRRTRRGRASTRASQRKWAESCRAYKARYDRQWSEANRGRRNDQKRRQRRRAAEHRDAARQESRGPEL